MGGATKPWIYTVNMQVFQQCFRAEEVLYTLFKTVLSPKPSSKSHCCQPTIVPNHYTVPL